MWGDQWADEIRRQRQLMNSMGAGTMDPYAKLQERAATDLTGDENRIDRMDQYAQALRGSPMPKGRSVGPSGIYVGPNWGEQLAYGLQQVMGGYMGKKANEADKKLAPRRLDKSMAALELDRANMLEGRQYDQSLAERARAQELADRSTQWGREDTQTASERDYKDTTRREDYRHEEEMARLEASLKNDGAVDGEFPDWQQKAINGLESATERKQAGVYINSIGILDEIIPQGERMKEEGKAWTSFKASAATEIAGRAPLFGESLQGKIESALYDDEELRMRQDLNAAFAQFRHSLTGANFTEMEKYLNRHGDPMQEGIDVETSLVRMKGLRDHMKMRLENMGVPAERPVDEEDDPLGLRRK